MGTESTNAPAGPAGLVAPPPSGAGYNAQAVADVAAQAVRWRAAAYANDPVLWLREQCRTFDEQRMLNIAPWPAHKPYIAELFDELLQHRFVAIEKSRQMFVTWIICAFAVWQLQFKGGARWGVMSTKSETANAAIQRCYHLWQNQSPWLKQLYPATYKENWLTWSNAGPPPGGPSWMQALSTTEASGRSFTFSTIWIDETAWQRNVAAAYTANMPAVASQGRVILSSSPLAGSFFCNVVDDKMEGASADDVADV